MYHLVCVTPFHNYVRGQKIEDPVEVENLLKDRDHHFVKVLAPVKAEEPVQDEAAQ